MSTTNDVAMTPSEAREQLLALLDAVQEIVGGEWENHDTPSPRACQLAENSPPGIAFTGRRTLTAHPASAQTVRAVATLLSSHGMEAGTRTGDVFTSVLGVHPLNKAFYVELEVRAAGTTVAGQSACVPGDLLVEVERAKTQSGELA
jgi:hypothetical protein